MAGVIQSVLTENFFQKAVENKLLSEYNGNV